MFRSRAINAIGGAVAELQLEQQCGRPDVHQNSSDAGLATTQPSRHLQDLQRNCALHSHGSDRMETVEFSKSTIIKLAQQNLTSPSAVAEICVDTPMRMSSRKWNAPRLAEHTTGDKDRAENASVIRDYEQPGFELS